MPDYPRVDLRQPETATALTGLPCGLVLSLALWSVLAIAWKLLSG